MAESVFRGPGFIAGPTMDTRVESMDGPSITYQGDALPDVRFSPTKKDGLYPGRVPVFLNSPYFVLADNIPQAISATAIAAAALQTASTPMVLTSAQVNGSAAGDPTLSPGVPLIPFGGITPVSVFALDFGFTTGTTTTGGASTTITVPDSTLFAPGQWIYFCGPCTWGKTAPPLTQILLLTSVTTLTISICALRAMPT